MDKEIVKWLSIAAMVIAVVIGTVKITEIYFDRMAQMQQVSRQVIEK